MCDLDVELGAELTGVAGASGTVEFEFELDKKGPELEFELELEGLSDYSDQSLNVFIDGQLVGQLDVDADGEGKLNSSTDADDDEGETSFSEAFLTISAGTLISVQLGDGTEVLGGAFAVMQEDDSENEDENELD